MIFSINKYDLRQTFAPHTFSSKHSFKHQEGKTNSMTSLSAFHNFCVHFSCFIFPHPGSKAKQEKALASNHSNFLNSRELLSKPRIYSLLEHLYQITALLFAPASWPAISCCSNPEAGKKCVGFLLLFDVLSLISLCL